MGEDTGHEIKEIQALIVQAEAVVEKLHRLARKSTTEPWQRWRVTQLDRHLRDAKREMAKLIEELTERELLSRTDGKSDGKDLTT